MYKTAPDVFYKEEDSDPVWVMVRKLASAGFVIPWVMQTKKKKEKKKVSPDRDLQDKEGGEELKKTKEGRGKKKVSETAKARTGVPDKGSQRVDNS